MHDSFITRSAVCTPTIITLTSFLEPISSLNLTSPYAGVRPLNFLSKAVKRRLPSHLCPHFKSGASERAEFRWDLNLYNYVRNGYYEENMLVSEMEPLTVSAPSGRLPPLAAPPPPPATAASALVNIISTLERSLWIHHTDLQFPLRFSSLVYLESPHGFAFQLRHFMVLVTCLVAPGG